jgi:FkbM family methyltransferase
VVGPASFLPMFLKGLGLRRKARPCYSHAMEFNEAHVFERFPYTSRGTFVDVGANLGDTCRGMIARGWPTVLFEPHPALCADLDSVYAQNDAVKVFQLAVADEPGELPFYTSEEHPGIHSLAPFHPTHRPTTTVRLVTLATALAELSITNVTALKIDVEGADFPALRGFDFEQQHPELIMVEFMDDRSSQHFGYTHHDMARFMQQRGYATVISEWAKLGEYGRHDHPVTHRWKRLRTYDPAWKPEPGVNGNLFFVASGDAMKLRATVARVLVEMQLRAFVRAVPGARRLHGVLMRT